MLPRGSAPHRTASQGRRQLGRLGEDAAVEALSRAGYRVVERNMRFRWGELDIVAEESGEIVFVEVKARRSVEFGTPAEAVGMRKRRTLALLAAGYLKRRRLSGHACRFDVVEVWVGRQDRVLRVEILRDAFRP